MFYYPFPANDGKHKLFIITIKGKKVYFGAYGMGDYPIYFKNKGSEKAEQMKNAYIKRHSGMNENWGKSGIDTAGFWSRWLLWNKPTLEASYSDIIKRFF